MSFRQPKKAMMLYLAFIFVSASAYSTDLYVDGVNGDDANTGLSASSSKKTIQAAVDISLTGDTVHVSEGVYPECINLNGKAISLIGAGADKTLVDQDANPTPVMENGRAYGIIGDVNRGSISLSGFTFNKGRMRLSGMDSLMFSSNIVTNEVLEVIGRGDFDASDYGTIARIKDNTFVESPFTSITVYTSNAIVEGNTLSGGSGMGVFLGYVINPVVSGNTISGLRVKPDGSRSDCGIGTWCCSGAYTITNNKISGCDCNQGIAIGSSSESTVVISSNVVINNTGTGIFVGYGKVAISDNIVTGNQCGIEAGGNIDSTLDISNNTVTGNFWGCNLNYNAAKTLVSKNNFESNAELGMWAYGNRDITIQENMFLKNGLKSESNYAVGLGCGSYGYGSAVIKNNTFTGNRGQIAPAMAGGLYQYMEVDGNTFDSNIGTMGGGPVRIEGDTYLVFSNNTVKKNTSPGVTGVYLVNNGYFVAKSNKFIDNAGRGLNIGNGPGEIDSNIFTNNSTVSDNYSVSGSAVSLHGFAGRMTNNLISGNTGGMAVSLQYPTGDVVFANNVVAKNGGGLELIDSIDVNPDGSPAKVAGIKVVNNSIVSNSGWGFVVARWGYAGNPYLISNNIFWGNSEYDMWNWSYWMDFADIIVSDYNDIGTANTDEFRGIGCISDDPLFANAVTEDYRLSRFSPCIDKGLNSAVLPLLLEKDFYGNSRISGQSVDIGAAEGADNAPPVTTCYVMPTLNADGWTSSDATLTLIAVDDGSGVKSVFYSATGAETLLENFVDGPEASFTLTHEGFTTVYFHALDNAGNSEAVKSQVIKIDKSGPVISVATDLSVLWPANGKDITVTVSGTISDAGIGVNLASTSFSVVDEYGLIQPAGKVTISPDGSYSFKVVLNASRQGSDRDGRQYQIRVAAADLLGNASATTSIVRVPHDKR